MTELFLIGIGTGNPDHLTRQAVKALNSVDEVNRKADGFALVGESPADGLFDPPACVGTKFNSAARFESFDGLHQTEISFGDEIENR